jgi:molybdopterin-containing oxidoreductase family iron-sulfur binding subunit
MMKINRREFLKAIGLGSTATAAACSADPVSWDPMVPIEHVYPYISQPEEIEPGNSSLITTSCNQCTEGCGLMAVNREGRIINVEGNKSHPLSKGQVCFQGITGLQETYSPDRLSEPVKDGSKVSWSDALANVAQVSTGNVTWIGRPRSGAMNALVKQFVVEALGGNLLYWDEMTSQSMHKATTSAFGIDGLPTFKLHDAHTIVNFGMDFLSAEGSVQLSQGWAHAKNPENGGFVTKMYSIGPRIGLTNTNTDIHISIEAGTESHFAYALAKLVAEKRGYTGPAQTILAGIETEALLKTSGANRELVEQLVMELSQKSSVSLPGGIEASNNAGNLSVAVLLLNEVCGNIGTSVHFGLKNSFEYMSSSESVLKAVNAAKGGTLFIDDLDLGYVFAESSDIKKLLSEVKNLVVFANEMNDGIPTNALVLPSGTGFEKWGDNESTLGLYTISQAAMKPVNGNIIMSAEDILLKVATNKGLSSSVAVPVPSEEPVDELIEDTQTLPEDIESGEEPSQPIVAAAPAPGLDAGDFLSYLKGWWESTVYSKYKTNGGSDSFRAFWTQSLKSGFFESKVDAIQATWSLQSYVAPSAPSFSGSGDLNLVLFPHPYTGLGKQSNRPWAREIPDPISGFSWGTWIEIHPKTADTLGLRKDKGVTLTTEKGSIEVGWFGSPGVREGVVGLVAGGGKVNSGRYATFGENPINVLDHSFNSVGDIVYSNIKATVKASTERNAPNPQNDLLKSDTLTKNDRYVNFTTSLADYDNNELTGTGSVVPEHHLPDTSMAMRSRVTKNRFHQSGKDTTPTLTDMYPEPKHPTYRFAMAVDLNQCNGCNACAVACYAENNIAIVGPEQVRLGRNMGWMRMSRYWEGTGVQEDGKPDVRFQPVMCQQCSHAPCEGVCPVLATYHNLDGLNAMIYNRCVGTRYCANNCPYSARRFNFHSYKWPESFNLMLTPDVLVREMGVMEKCTFCVQKIRQAKDKWRDSRDFKQGKAMTDFSDIAVCASACPSGCITFGNLKDEESEIYKKFNDRRAFKMLNELNTKPGVAYLTRIVHENETFLHHGGHGDHGAGHGDGHGEHGDEHGDDHGHKEDAH